MLFVIVVIGCIANNMVAMDLVKQELFRVNPFVHSFLKAHVNWHLGNMHPYQNGPLFKCNYTCTEETELLSLRVIAMETEFRNIQLNLRK